MKTVILAVSMFLIILTTSFGQTINRHQVASERLNNGSMWETICQPDGATRFHFGNNTVDLKGAEKEQILSILRTFQEFVSTVSKVQLDEALAKTSKEFRFKDPDGVSLVIRFKFTTSGYSLGRHGLWVETLRLGRLNDQLYFTPEQVARVIESFATTDTYFADAEKKVSAVTAIFDKVQSF